MDLLTIISNTLGELIAPTTAAYVLAAIGLNTDLVKLVRKGGRPILMGFCCWISIAVVSLFVQKISSGLF